MPAQKPTVFLSYSRKDKRWLDELRTMLAPLVRDSVVDVWWDGDIKPSQKWREEIDHALASVRIGVLLVSPNFLASDFINRNELPYLVDAAEKREVTLLWVLLSDCLHEHTPLGKIQAVHDVSRPIRTLRPAERAVVLKEIGQRIVATAAEDLTPCPPLPSPSLPPGEGGRRSAAVPIHHLATAEGSPSPGRAGVRWERGTGGEVRLDLGRLPIAGPLLLGRETELTRLDAAWKDPGLHVLTFVAFGGMGKALLSHWLDRMANAGWRGARRVL